MSHGLVEIGFPQLADGDLLSAAGPVATAVPRSFLTGEENRLAVVALAALGTSQPVNRDATADRDPTADRDAAMFNPLVLHGPSGVGKSHLALTLACEFQQRRPRARVLHVCGADFARDFAHAVDRRTMQQFRDSYRSADLLVLDGLDALADKPAAQQELICTLDAILDERGRVVVTAARPLRELTSLLPALRDRLAAGLCVPVAVPGAAARLALLRRFAAARQIDLPETAAQALADGLADSAPALCGALLKLALEQRNTGGNINVATVRRFLRSQQPAVQHTLREIGQWTAKQFGLRLAQLKGPARQRKIAVARSVAIYLARQHTNFSLERIGEFFGGRDHTTALHSVRRVEQLLEDDPVVLAAVSALRRRLSGAPQKVRSTPHGSAILSRPPNM